MSDSAGRKGTRLEGDKQIVLRLVQLIVALAIVAAGVATLVGMRKLKSPPEKEQARDRAPTVRVIEAALRDVRVTLRAEGTADYKRRVEIRTQVGGKIVQVSPNLEDGKRVAKDELLVVIEQTDYTLAVRRAQAEVNVYKAALTRLAQDEKNSRKLIGTLRDDLELAQAEVARAQRLLSDGAGSQAEVDNARRTFLRQRNTLEIAENSLALLPARTDEQRAMMQAAEVRLDEARLALARTEIRSPFDAVVATEDAEEGNVVQIGQGVAVLGDDSVMEVTAMLSFSELGALCSSEEDLWRNPGCAGTPATVVWKGMGIERRWRGEVSRLGTVDPATRTAPIVVAVQFPDDARARLLSGVYCQVEIAGREIEGVLVVPRSALREGNRLFLERGGKLEIADVHTVRGEGDELIVDRGLSLGDKVILSEILFPVHGMSVKTIDMVAPTAEAPPVSSDDLPEERGTQD